MPIPLEYLKGRKQEEAIAALLTQRNVEEAARTINFAPRTLLRWLQMPEFEDAYRQARPAAFGQTIARMQQASGAAVSILLKIMGEQQAVASTRVRAADTILNHATKAIEIEDVSVRLARLDELAKESGKNVERGPTYMRPTAA